jgi:curli biogenesis system outer membrane secretion channel CsgG
MLPALLVAFALPLSAQNTSADTRPTVAVLYFTNSALVDFNSYAPLSKGMAEMLINEIAQNSAVRVVERDRLQPLLEEQNLQNSDRVDKETAVKLGKTLGARHMLMGSFVIDPNKNMRIDVRAVNTETSAIEYVQTVNGKSDNLLDLVMQLGQKINAGLKLPALKTASATIPASKNPNQFKAMMAMSQALEAEDKKDIPARDAFIRTAVSLAPEYKPLQAKVAMITRE